jgi:hypothetical protein
MASNRKTLETASAATLESTADRVAIAAHVASLVFKALGIANPIDRELSLPEWNGQNGARWFLDQLAIDRLDESSRNLFKSMSQHIDECARLRNEVSASSDAQERTALIERWEKTAQQATVSAADFIASIEPNYSALRVALATHAPDPAKLALEVAKLLRLARVSLTGLRNRPTLAEADALTDDLLAIATQLSQDEKSRALQLMRRPPGRPRTDGNRPDKQIREMREQGMPRPAIADALGLTVAIVARSLDSTRHRKPRAAK